MLKPKASGCAAPCPRGQVLPLSLTHTPRPLTSRQVPLWVESQKHRMSEIEKARVLSGTPPHPLNAHLSLRTFWISDRPLCKQVHWTLGKCRTFIQSQDEQLSDSLQIESKPSSRQHPPLGMKQILIINGRLCYCGYFQTGSPFHSVCSQLPIGGAVQRRTTRPRVVCPSEGRAGDFDLNRATGDDRKVQDAFSLSRKPDLGSGSHSVD